MKTKIILIMLAAFMMAVNLKAQQIRIIKNDCKKELSFDKYVMDANLNGETDDDVVVYVGGKVYIDYKQIDNDMSVATIKVVFKGINGELTIVGGVVNWRFGEYVCDKGTSYILFGRKDNDFLGVGPSGDNIGKLLLIENPLVFLDSIKKQVEKNDR